jgi:hypothetical protein
MKNKVGIILLACLVTFTGCSGSVRSTTQTAAQNMAGKTISAVNSVSTFQLNTDFTDTLSTNSSGSNTTDLKGSKLIDITDRALAMNMAITAGPLVTTNELYFLNGQEYLETTNPSNIPAIWGSKTEFNDKDWKQQTQIQFLSALLNTAVKISSLPDEKLNNVDCAVLTITPAAQAAVDFIISQFQYSGPAPFSMEGGATITPDAYQGGSITLWINSENYLPVKVEAAFRFQNKENWNANSSTTLITANYNIELDFSNYNQPVSIQVPPDVLAASNIGS